MGADDDPRGDFMTEATRRNWLNRNGGFVLDRPGMGFELVCTTIHGSAHFQNDVVKSTQGQHLELLWHRLKGQLGRTCATPLLTCFIAENSFNEGHKADYSIATRAVEIARILWTCVRR